MSQTSRNGAATDLAEASGTQGLAFAGGQPQSLPRDVRQSLPRDVRQSLPRDDASEPWERVLSLGDRAVKIGAAIGIVLGLGTHGIASARAMLALYDMQKGVDSMRASIHEFLWSEYDIDLKQEEKKVEEPPKEKEEPPPPPPETEPEPVVQQPAPKVNEPPPKDDPYESEKAAPVEAAKIITAPANPDTPVDLTDQGMVSGENTAGPLGGQSAKEGTSNIITKNTSVSLSGKPGGTGTAEPKAPPPPPKQDLSRMPSPIGSSWNCPFPPEADDEQIDFAQPVVMVTIRPDGTASSAQVQSDPGHGFGRAARLCALSRKYNPGLDSDGNPTTKSVAFRVTFHRN